MIAVVMAIPWQIPCYFSLGLICLVLNSLEIVLILRKLSRRKSSKAFEIFLFSLSCSDILVGLTMVVIIIYLIANSKSSNFIMPRSNVWFLTFVSCMAFSTTTTVLNVLAIGLDRLLAVRYPFRHRTWMTSRLARSIVTGIWIFDITAVISIAVPLSISNARNNKLILPVSFVYVTTTCIFLASLIFIFFYSSILLTVFRGVDDELEAGQENNRHKKKAAKNRHLAATCILVMATFLVCSVPVPIELLTTIGEEQRNFPQAIILIILNSTLNPLIYFYRSLMERRLSTMSQS